jgi:siroheme synthase
MGVGTAGEWSGALIAGGKPPDTPVAIIRQVSNPDQEIYRCTLGTVTGCIEEHDIEPPSVFVIGNVVERGPELSWFGENTGP